MIRRASGARSVAVTGENAYLEVIGLAGMRGRVDAARWPLDRGPPEGPGPGDAVQVLLEDGGEVLVPRATLRPLGDGRYEFDAPPGPRGTETVIPVVQEEARVTTRTVDRGGVRVRKVVREREEVVRAPVRGERAIVERVMVQREVSGPMPAREEDGVVVVPVVEEVLVTRKAWVLREEIRIRKQGYEVERPRRVTLRSEDVVVERLEPETPPREG